MQYYFWHLKNLKLDKGKLKGRQSSHFFKRKGPNSAHHMNPEYFLFPGLLQ